MIKTKIKQSIILIISMTILVIVMPENPAYGQETLILND